MPVSDASENMPFYYAILSSRIFLLNIQFNFLITQPKNREVLNVLDTFRRRLQLETSDIDTIFRLNKHLQQSMQNNIIQTIIVQYFT